MAGTFRLGKFGGGCSSDLVISPLRDSWNCLKSLVCPRGSLFLRSGGSSLSRNPGHTSRPCSSRPLSNPLGPGAGLRSQLGPCSAFLALSEPRSCAQIHARTTLPATFFFCVLMVNLIIHKPQLHTSLKDVTDVHADVQSGDGKPVWLRQPPVPF